MFMLNKISESESESIIIFSQTIDNKCNDFSVSLIFFKWRS